MEKSSALINANQRLFNGRLWDWRAAFLVIALVEISSTRLVETGWVPYLYFTQTMGLIGAILGLALGMSKFPRRTVIYLSAGYTLVLIPIQLLSATERTSWLWRDIVTLFEHLFISFDLFIRNKPVPDRIFFISFVTLLYWLIGLFAGYYATRRVNFLNAVVPSGLAMLIVQAFDSFQSKHVWEIAVFIFVSLLLLGRMYILQNKSFWKKTRLLLTEEAINDLERGTLIITAIAVFIAWSLPGWINNIKPAAQAWHNFSQPVFDKFSNAVNALNSPYAGDDEGSDFYSDSLTLGQQAASGKKPIFTVNIKGNKFIPIRNYWKGRTYNQYLNGRWSNVSDSSEPFLPSVDELSIEQPQGRHEIQLTFTNMVKTQSLLYAPAETIWVSQSADIFSTPASEWVKDVTAWIAVKGLSRGSQYKVRALVADPSIEELRSAGAEYPAWVTDRYLQIPADIAPQLNELAIEIVAPYNTVYDKAQAITSYLRNEIEYEPKLKTALPKNQDPVLWVLFDTKRGFCMYYASAEVLMLRSIGIPARMAVGFAEGTYDESKWRYVVAYEDAHAWPEVYFPGIGWVEFEPTSSQPPIERLETKNGTDNGTVIVEEPLTPLAVRKQSGKIPSDVTSVAVQIKSYINILIVLLIILTFGLGVFIIRRYSLNDRLPVYLANQYEQHGNAPPHWLKRWILWIKLSPVERAFQVVNLSLIWLGHPQPGYVTSQERAEVLIKYLPLAQDQILSLIQEYQITVYTAHAGNISTARKAAIAILIKTLQLRLKMP
jgi:transglutaminase-like putative cysteine protease